MWLLIVTIVCLILQGSLLLFDEWIFHRRRGLSKFESWGHPLDGLFFSIPLFIAAFSKPAVENVIVFGVFSVFSTLFITKDEWIHSVACRASEHWIHSLLFVIHPVSLFGVGWLWVLNQGADLRLIAPFMVLTLVTYQWIYWVGMNRATSNQ